MLFPSFSDKASLKASYEEAARESQQSQHESFSLAVGVAKPFSAQTLLRGALRRRQPAQCETLLLLPSLSDFIALQLSFPIHCKLLASVCSSPSVLCALFCSSVQAPPPIYCSTPEITAGKGCGGGEHSTSNHQACT